MELFGEPNGCPREVSGRFIILHASLIRLMCFALGFYEALLRLLKPTDKQVWNLDLQFHLEALVFMTIFSSLRTNKFYTTILYSPYIFPSASPPTSSLLPFLQKKTARTSPKTFSEWQEVHVGMEPSKTNQTFMHLFSFRKLFCDFFFFILWCHKQHNSEDKWKLYFLA